MPIETSTKFYREDNARRRSKEPFNVEDARRLGVLLSRLPFLAKMAYYARFFQTTVRFSISLKTRFYPRSPK